MSADAPGSTTYSSGFGPRTGTIRKPDPYASPPKSPRAADSMLDGHVPPTLDPGKLSYSLAEQYKLKKYRDENADRILADVDAYHREENEKIYSARRQRDSYRDSLQEQIRLRSASRDSERKKDLESKKATNQDFEQYVKETLKHKEDQRQKHLEYCKQVQQQHAENTNLNTKRKNCDEAIAEMMIRDAQQKKIEDDQKKAEKRNLQKQLADEMKRIQDEKLRMKEERRKQQAIEDREYLKYVDEKAAQAEHERATLNKSKQKILPSVTLPKLETKPETMPDYLSILAEAKIDQAKSKAEHQRQYREALLKQMEDKHVKKDMEKTKGVQARQMAEQDAVAYAEEQVRAKQHQRELARENENQLAFQMMDSVRRRYRLEDNEWKTLSQNKK